MSAVEADVDFSVAAFITGQLKIIFMQTAYRKNKYHKKGRKLPKS